VPNRVNNSAEQSIQQCRTAHAAFLQCRTEYTTVPNRTKQRNTVPNRVNNSAEPHKCADYSAEQHKYQNTRNTVPNTTKTTVPNRSKRSKQQCRTAHLSLINVVIHYALNPTKERKKNKNHLNTGTKSQTQKIATTQNLTRIYSPTPAPRHRQAGLPWPHWNTHNTKVRDALRRRPSHSHRQALHHSGSRQTNIWQGQTPK
jgi:hypothetical protein